MKISSKGGMAGLAFGAALLSANITPASAQGPGPGFGFGGVGLGGHYAYVGIAMAPNCPPMQFHVVPMGNNQLHGIAYEEKPNMQAFEVHGTMTDDGKTSMDLKPMGGGSPIKVDGTFRGGMLMASMKGSSKCDSTSFMLMPVAQPVAGAESSRPGANR